MVQLNVNEYQIGWICALPSEYAMAAEMLDEEHEMMTGQERGDSNSYTIGRIHNHNVVIACLPAGVDGTDDAAVVATNLSRTFPSIRFGLIVGIGGGIPNLQEDIDIRLGDVVVSQPSGATGGVVQYDKGKSHDHLPFERKGQLNKPPTTLLTALAKLRAKHESEDSHISEYLKEVFQKRPKMQKNGYSFPVQETDVLNCTHTTNSASCERCEGGKIVRILRKSSDPVIHYGVIASGNQVIKSATHRDQLRDDCGAICVEMEAAGLMNNFPCLVIRGICDYADSSKNDKWHRYAAATAAAFAKELLLYVSSEQASQEQPFREALNHLNQQLQSQHEHNTRMQGHSDRVEEHNKQQEIRHIEIEHRNCHRAFGISDYERQKNINTEAVPGTCRWVLDHPCYYEWYTSTRNDLLWISADPGCGKSVLSKLLVDTWPKSTLSDQYTICYFFFKDNNEQNNVSIALCAILHQLFRHQPKLIRYALPAFNENKGEMLIKKTDELWRILRLAAADTSAKPIVCVLDALDECSDRHLLVDQLFRFFRASTSSSETHGYLKWLITSRAYDDIQAGFLPVKLIRLRGEDETDQIRHEIDLVINQRMREIGSRFKLTDTKREEIAQQLHDMDNRTYLWLYLVLEDIEVVFRRSPRPNQVTVPLLPATVDQAYERILQRNTETDIEQRRYVRLVLTIIVGAQRPLSIAEMALAFEIATCSDGLPRSLADFTIDPDDLSEKIRHWCGLFVFIRRGRLYLIHQTAKEFLMRYNSEHSITNFTNWKGCLHSEDICEQMAKICVIFLSLSEFNDASLDIDRLRNGRGTFFKFASRYWADFVLSIESKLDIQLLSSIRALYDSQSERFDKWKTSMCRMRGLILWPGDDVHTASFNGHCISLQHILSTDPHKVNQLDQNLNSPLLWAIHGVRREVTELLLAHPSIDVNLGNPLLKAAQFGHKDIVELLLSHPGIYVNLGAPLSIVASQGDEEMVELLLAHPDIDVNLEKPLLKAAYYRHKDIVELLLCHPGIDVNLGAPLSIAASQGEKEMVELLLANPSIDVNLEKPLPNAALNGHRGIIELLLAHPSIDVNLGKPLSKAAHYGHKDIVELLLARPGLDVNLGRPLSTAAKFGYKDTVELLLAHPDIDVDLGEPLSQAARCGRKDIVKLLLAHPGIDVNLGKPLSKAAVEGHTGVIKLLLSHPDIDVNSGRPLSMAAYYGRKNDVELLLAQPKISSCLEESLFFASRKGHERAVKLLLSQASDDVDLNNPISQAARSGHQNIVALLWAHQPLAKGQRTAREDG